MRAIRTKRYSKKTLRKKNTRSKSKRLTRLSKRRVSKRSNRKGQRKRQRGGQSVTTSAGSGCQDRGPLVDNNALEMQASHPSPNITQPPSSSYNDFALVNDRSGLFIKM